MFNKPGKISDFLNRFSKKWQMIAPVFAAIIAIATIYTLWDKIKPICCSPPITPLPTVTWPPVDDNNISEMIGTWKPPQNISSPRVFEIVSITDASDSGPGKFVLQPNHTVRGRYGFWYGAQGCDYNIKFPDYCTMRLSNAAGYNAGCYYGELKRDVAICHRVKVQ